MSRKKELVKIQFYNSDVGYENLWADELGKNKYRIESIPFFVYGVSRHDVVTASPDNDGRLQFGAIQEPSGNRTLRARSEDFMADSRFRKMVTLALKKLGCDAEELRSRLLAIDVPSDVNLQIVTDYLTNEAKVSWEYGNPETMNKNKGA